MMNRMAAGLVLAVATLGLTACESVSQRPNPLAGSVIDEANLNDLMLQAGDPEEAIRYFQESLAREPDRTDFRRGLAVSLVRAKRFPEAAGVYQELITLNQDEPEDRLEYAYVLMRLDRIDEATTVASTLPAGMDTSRRYMLDAMVDDMNADLEDAMENAESEQDLERAYQKFEASRQELNELSESDQYGPEP